MNKITQKVSAEVIEDNPTIVTLAIDAAKFKKVKGLTILSKILQLAQSEINRTDQ